MKKARKKFKYDFTEEDDFNPNKAGREMWAKDPRKQKPKVKKFKYKDL
tara:strand:- start:358 stop:501 length:144 start_codon:yes stop_codon:yes gene_type:complete